jgi:glycosyltransferase involved in cell wall biosynthesis
VRKVGTAEHQQSTSSDATLNTMSWRVGRGEDQQVTRFVLTWLSTAAGGAERSVGELAVALAADGHEVVLVWWDTTSADTNTLDDHQVTVCQVADLPGYRAAMGRALHTAAGAVVISTHRTMLVDVAMAQWHAVPIVVVVRALLLAEGRLRILDEVSGQLGGHTPHELNWDVLAAADCWVGVSTAATRCLLAHAPQGIRVERIYNGVPVNTQGLPQLPRRVRHIGVVARAEPWKRIDRLFTAFAALPEHLSARMCAHVFGDGPELRELRRQARELGVTARTVFHGHVGLEWTQRCDVLVSTCEIEAFGRVVVEAGAAGLPQIVPDQGGAAELVIPGMTGLHYDVDDPTALTHALAEVAAWSPADYHRHATAAHTHARRFSLATCAAAYARLAAELLTGHRGENAIA